MIRIPLLGRTGNNLFQYAMGRALAEKHGVGLVLDASWFNSRGWSEVSHFLKLPLKATVRRHPSLASRGLRKITGKHYWEYTRTRFIQEKTADHSFDPSLLEAPSNCVLFGYFQSPLYFESISDSLRREINDLVAGSVHPDPKLQEKLASPSAVAVHVRRTDFLEQAVFQVCSPGYYQLAISEMRKNVPNAHFFIFSDDTEWCLGEFTAPDQTVIDTHPLSSNPLHDLHLMSLASHHIIANSSYSWWAAWLGKKPGQQVLMPDRWFASEIIAPVCEKRLAHWKVLSCG